MPLKMKTRLSRTQPTAEQRAEDAARRNRVQKSIMNAQQEEAFGEFLNLLGCNGGKPPYGAVKKLIKSYHVNGYKAVTRKNLYYRLSQTKRKTPLAMSISVTGHTQVSDLSGETNITDLAETSADVESIEFADEPVSVIYNAGGRGKGSTKDAAKEKKHDERIGYKMCYIVQQKKGSRTLWFICSKWNA